MSLVTVLNRAQNSLQADLVTVEAHLAPGLPGLSIVGLPAAAVSEPKYRVKAAISTCSYPIPKRCITCNLARPICPRSGRFDLDTALGILTASGQTPLEALENFEVLSERSLSCEIRTVPGVLPAAQKAATAGYALLVP